MRFREWLQRMVLAKAYIIFILTCSSNLAFVFVRGVDRFPCLVLFDPRIERGIIGYPAAYDVHACILMLLHLPFKIYLIIEDLLKL